MHYSDYRVACPPEQTCKCFAINLAAMHVNKIIDFRYDAQYPKVNLAIESDTPNEHTFVIATDSDDHILPDGLVWNATTRILYFLPQAKPTRFAVWIKQANSNASCGGWEWQAQELCLVLEEVPCGTVTAT